jgi:osmotically-inducible protein OsmY
VRLSPLALIPCLALALAPGLAGRSAAPPPLAREPGLGTAPPVANEGLVAALHDGWLRASVTLRLYRSPEVSGRDVEVGARGGVVTLSGMVPCLAAQAAAELAAAKLAGVQRVENWIEVVPEAEQAAARARDRALERRLRARLAAAHGIASPDLEVASTNRVVRVHGTVSGPSEHRAVLDALARVGGARAVIDRLRQDGASPAG